MVQITVKEGNEKWIEPINPVAGKITVQLKVNWIIGNFGYNAGDIVKVPTATAQNLIRNGKAVQYVPPKRGPGRPKKKKWS
jgi:hypothetical protein